MPLLVLDLIEQAREVHPTFDETANPDKVVAGALSRWQQEMVDRVKVLEPDFLAEWFEYDLPIADFELGQQLPDFERVLQSVVQEPDGFDVELHLIPHHQRAQPAMWPSIWVQEGVAYQVGEEDEWTRYSKIRIRYVPTPIAIASVNDQLVLPDSARPAAVAHLAAFMGNRTANVPGGAPPIPRDLFNARALAADEAFLMGMSQRRVVVARIPEVY